MNFTVIRKEENVLLNDALDTFTNYMVFDIAKDHSVKEETCCCHFMGYSY